MTQPSTTVSRPPLGNMASSTENPGSQVSAAMLMDPRAMRNHLANGTVFSSHSESTPAKGRQSSEPLFSTIVSSKDLTSHEALSQYSKDDAYQFSMTKGKNAVATQHVGQRPSTQVDAKRLLDPAGFDKTIAKTQEIYTGSTPPDYAGLVSISGNGPQKRDHNECEGQGIGSLIERVHNVSQREERPHKNQKAENFEDDHDMKAMHRGGGKGGEIGEYMKQKKKEGMAESGSINPVVDLTGGQHYMRLQKSAC